MRKSIIGNLFYIYSYILILLIILDLNLTIIGLKNGHNEANKLLLMLFPIFGVLITLLINFIFSIILIICLNYLFFKFEDNYFINYFSNLGIILLIVERAFIIGGWYVSLKSTGVI